MISEWARGFSTWLGGWNRQRRGCPAPRRSPADRCEGGSPAGSSHRIHSAVLDCYGRGGTGRRRSPVPVRHVTAINRRQPVSGSELIHRAFLPVIAGQDDRGTLGGARQGVIKDWFGTRRKIRTAMSNTSHAIMSSHGKCAKCWREAPSFGVRWRTVKTQHLS